MAPVGRGRELSITMVLATIFRESERKRKGTNRCAGRRTRPGCGTGPLMPR